MADPNLAMSVDELKKALLKARGTPANCAVASGYGEIAEFALILVDKVRKPKVLAKRLIKTFSGAGKVSFGEVTTEGKIVTLKVNQLISGLDKKMIRTLKGTGFNKAEIALTGADDDADDNDDDDDDDVADSKKKGRK